MNPLDERIRETFQAQLRGVTEAGVPPVSEVAVDAPGPKHRRIWLAAAAVLIIALAAGFASLGRTNTQSIIADDVEGIGETTTPGPSIVTPKPSRGPTTTAVDEVVVEPAPQPTSRSEASAPSTTLVVPASAVASDTPTTVASEPVAESPADPSPTTALAPSTTVAPTVEPVLVDFEQRMTVDLAAGTDPTAGWTTEPFWAEEDVNRERGSVGINVCTGEYECIIIGGAKYIVDAGNESVGWFDPADPASFQRGTDATFAGPDVTSEIVDRGFAPVGGKTAVYGVFERRSATAPDADETIRYWYLPRSRILIEASAALGDQVDRILATATFRGANPVDRTPYGSCDIPQTGVPAPSAIGFDVDDDGVPDDVAVTEAGVLEVWLSTGPVLRLNAETLTGQVRLASAVQIDKTTGLALLNLDFGPEEGSPVRFRTTACELLRP